MLTLFILSTFRWKQRSRSFKIWSCILDVPVLFGLISSIMGLAYPLMDLTKLHNKLLTHLAVMQTQHFIVGTFIWLMIVVFFMLFMINGILSVDYDNKHNNQKKSLMKKYPHRFISGFFLVLMAVFMIFPLCNGRKDGQEEYLIRQTYRYRTSKAYHAHIDKLKPKNHYGKILKWNIQNYKGKHIKRYIFNK